MLLSASFFCPCLAGPAPLSPSSSFSCSHRSPRSPPSPSPSPLPPPRPQCTTPRPRGVGWTRRAFVAQLAPRNDFLTCCDGGRNCKLAWRTPTRGGVGPKAKARFHHHLVLLSLLSLATPLRARAKGPAAGSSHKVEPGWIRKDGSRGLLRSRRRPVWRRAQTAWRFDFGVSCQLSVVSCPLPTGLY